MLVSYNERVSFEVAVKNKLENAYNTQLLVKYSSNLYYAFVSNPVSYNTIRNASTTNTFTGYYCISCKSGKGIN